MIESKLDEIMKTLGELSKRLENIEEKMSVGETPILAIKQSAIDTRGESFMEFFNKFKPDKETDKTLVIMSFLESRKNMANITTKNITDGFKEVREKVPTNVADKIQMLHKKGLIMPGENVDNLKGWMITRTGMEYLELMKDGKNK